MKPELHNTKKIVLFAGAIGLTLAVATGLTLATLRSSNKKDGARDRDKKISRLQHQRGVVAQIKLAHRGDSRDAVRQSVESVSSFIQRRSGLIFSNTLKERLITLEQESLNDPRKRISPQVLTSILTTTAAERLASLTDDEVARMRATMATGLPAGDSNGISLRGNGRGSISQSEFTAIVRNARLASRNQDLAFQQSLGEVIGAEVDERVDAFNMYASNHFGGIKRHGLSPLQMVLIIYSVTADDPLVHSQETLEAQAQLVYGKMPGGFKHGQPLVNPYGAAGYRYATPLNIVLDEGTMQKLLDRVVEKEGM